MISRTAILKSLNIKQEEEKKFMYLFFHSFSLGLFIALYFLSANSLFIEHFESKDLPLAYVCAGGVGYIVSLIYSYMQRRVQSRTLFLTSLAFLALIPILSRILLGYLPEKWMSFFVFLWAWPFISLVSTESGGLALQKLNLRQVKKLYGLINAGGVSASILSYLSVPLVLKLLPSAFDLLALSSVGALVGFGLLLKIYKEYPDKTKDEEGEEKKRTSKRAGLKEIFKDRYLSLLFVSAFLSIISIYLIDFGFLSGVKAQKEFLPDAKSVSSFFAMVFSVLKVLELITSLYSGRWLARYGIRFGLAALPVSMFTLMLLAAFSGFSWGTTSMLLFVVLILGKATERFVRRSLEDPAFNVLYQPLPEEDQLIVQTRVGVVVQISIGIAGIMLLGANFLLDSESGFQLEYFPLLLIPLFGVWLYVAFVLYRQYRLRLRQILLDKSKEMAKSSYRYRYGDETLRRKLKPFDKYVSRLATIILSESASRQLYRYCVPLLAENDDIVSPAVLRSCSPSFPVKLLRVLEGVGTEHLPIEAKENVRWATLCVSKETPEPQTEKEEILLNLKEIQGGGEIDSEVLMGYLEHEDNQIRKTAIEIAGSLNDNKIQKILIELLEIDEYRNFVADVLTENSQDVLEDLEELFQKTSKKEVLLKIIEIWAKIGTSLARKLLVQKIEYLERDVQIAAIKGLHFCRYEADEADRNMIVRKIQQVIASILWITVCMKQMEDQLNVLKLQQSLELDLNESYDLLFSLLSFLYTPTTIELIKKNIVGENTIFALEIIENFMAPDIKELVVPLFENISVSQKLKRLENIVTVEKLKFTDRLSELVVSDFYILNDWTRSKAIELIGRLHRKKSSKRKQRVENEDLELKLWTRDNVEGVLDKIRKSEMPDEIFVSMYHPSELVYSTAAKIIYDENPTRCLNYIKTLAPEKQFLTKVFQSKDEMLLIERLKYIKRHLLFFNIPERTLVKIAQILQPLRFRAGDTIDLADEQFKGKILVLLDGIIESEDENVVKVFKKNDVILPEINLPKSSPRLIVKKKAFVFYGSRSIYFNLLMDDTDIIHHMFDDL